MIIFTQKEEILFSSVGFTKSRAFPTKSGQNISSSIEFTKTRAFAAKSGQNISSSNNIHLRLHPKKMQDLMALNKVL